MRCEVLRPHPRVILHSLDNHKAAFRRSCSQDKSVLPGCPCDAVDRGAEIQPEHQILPIIVRVAFPDAYLAIVAARCDYTLVLRMRPADLPDRPFMRLKRHLSTLLSIISHTANLQEALAVTARDLCAIVVELAIIDVILMLSVHAEDIVLRGWRRLLAAIDRLLLSLPVVRLLRWLHHLVLILILLLGSIPAHRLLLKLLSVHFFLSCQY